MDNNSKEVLQGGFLEIDKNVPNELWQPTLLLRVYVHTDNNLGVSDGQGGVMYPSRAVGQTIQQKWVSSFGNEEWRNLPEEVEPANIEQLANMIRTELAWNNNWAVEVENRTIIVEESYEMTEDEKNDDDCVDNAHEIGNTVCAMFPQLEIADAYCHRHKYSIVNLKLKGEETAPASNQPLDPIV